jgi:hypothetical protein
MHHSPLDDLRAQFYDGEPWTTDTNPCAQAYGEAGFDKWEAQRWFAAGVGPADAVRFRDMDMSPEEAHSWGLHPDLVARFRALAFTKAEAREWAMAPIWPDHAVHWRHAGYGPSSAHHLITLSSSPAAALAWTLTRLDEEGVIYRAEEGCDPGRILEHEYRPEAGSGGAAETPGDAGA